MKEYKNNSVCARNKQEEKPTVEVVEAKEPSVIESVIDYVVKDVVIPMAKEAVLNAVNGGLAIIFYGDANQRRTTVSGGRRDYSSISSRSNSVHTQQSSSSSKDVSAIPIKSYSKALEIIESLKDNLKEYGQISVADFKDAAEVTSVFTDNDWGWKDITGAFITQNRDGYFNIHLSKPKKL